MTRWPLVLAVILTIVLPVTGGEDDARAAKRKLRPFTKTDTVAQSGGNYTETQGAGITPAGDPFTFEKVARIRRLTHISITATINDLDAGPGEDEEDQLTLALGGIDTGISLNGFRDDNTDTLTIRGAPENRAQIIAALKADGELAATITDTVPGSNGFSVPATADTTLVLEGKLKRKKR
jgi:hypothetical protein